MEKFYISTAIAYASGKPHIGNVYEAVLADSIARYMRFIGKDVYFQTGTDEHGQKIEDNAKKAGISPQQYVDNITSLIKDLYLQMNVSFDNFVRTTDDHHKNQVSLIFKKLYDQGDIYKGEYNGKYCKHCESFFTESQLIEGKCPDCGREVVVSKEEAYFLKLSKYSGKLVEIIEKNKKFIEPELRKNEMLNNFIKNGLQDLCVSRVSCKWGIPVSFDDKHTVYVWIDALSNYITGLGYDVNGNHGENFNKYWPCDIHLIGKDILRFHTIYWPIILMALGLELPKQIFGHPWLLVGDGKMSKSKGNTIYSDDLCNLFGVDAVRYIMLKEMPFATDGKITYESMIERINTDLANVYGNLVSRTLSMADKYFEGTVKYTELTTEFDSSILELISNLPEVVDLKMKELKVSDSIEEIVLVLRRTNKYIDETTPWILAKDETKQEELQRVLYTLLESIRICTILLKSFIPETAEKVLSYLNTKLVNNTDLVYGLTKEYVLKNENTILFNRIDEKDFFENVLKSESVSSEIEDNSKSNNELISFDSFTKVKMIVGKVLECVKHPDADRLLIFKIDSGTEVKTIVSGLAKHYIPENLINKNIVFVDNLQPVKIKGVESYGMLLTIEDKNGLDLIFTEREIGSVIR